jgi:hypothetical protein
MSKCPYLGGKACIKDKCAAWLSDPVEKDGKTIAHSACVIFFWTPLYLRTLAARADGTQKAFEGFRNEVHQGNEVFSSLMALKGGAQPALLKEVKDG